MAKVKEDKKSAEEVISVSLAGFEQPVLSGNYPEAEKVLQIIMLNQRRGKMEFNLKPADRALSAAQEHAEGYQIIEKLATLITMMFSDTKYNPSNTMFQEFVLGKKFLAYLFAASSYQNTDHIIRNLGLDTKGSFTQNDIRKFMICYVPDSTFDLPWGKLAAHMPSEICRGYLGLMSSFGLLLSDASAMQSNKIANVSKEIPLVTFAKPQNLEIMSSSFFNVSNFVGNEKFQFKKWAAANYKKFMDGFISDGIKKSISLSLEKARNKAKGEKKTILIIHEHYRQSHAMYRCYHSLFSALKADYNIVGLAGTRLVDEVGQQDHHSFREFDDVNDIAKIIKHVVKVQPDVIIYPSLGMSNFAPLLASTRLAPIQCVCPGHPASSFIDTIDYLLLEDMGLSQDELAKIATEKTVVIETEALRFSPNTYTLRELPSTPEVCNIAVNGVIQKVSSQVLSLCQEISAGIERKVVFHFFMAHGIQDLDYYAALSILRRKLPNAVMHPYSTYDDYMNTVAQCEFALPTMPFGGANSNIDVARLGIPKLFVKDTSDLPGVTDYYIWNELGELTGLCKDQSELVTRAIELGNDSAKLSEFKALIQAIDINSFLLDDKDEVGDLRLVKAMHSLLN
ncbi:hypothetical protein KO495_01205 [Colwellia sp. D2M02]|uniref:hypothetical protein n=1 Tax=Colwellia sp. D2M02 TaxID=2841562 RepID=UPI001C086CDB|nr:hypothetical protein [Colwellia sp. D2M02]MBU2891936.1 hypothetical protein [Colwellia sp. D2M02]